MEPYDSLPALSSHHPDLLDNLDGPVRALNHASDQTLSHIENNAFSSSTQISGPMRWRKDSDTPSHSAIDFVEGSSRSRETVTDVSFPNASYFPTQAAFPPEQVTHATSASRPFTTSSNERPQSSIIRSRSEATWSDDVEEAFQKGLPCMRDFDCTC